MPLLVTRSMKPALAARQVRVLALRRSSTSFSSPPSSHGGFGAAHMSTIRADSNTFLGVTSIQRSRYAFQNTRRATTSASAPSPTPPPTSETEVVLNPRKDDDGNDMTIEITPRAAHRLKQIMKTDSNPSLALRVTVESGGCHGFQYLMSLTDMSTVSPEEDTVFQGRDGARVVMDEPSLELLTGSKVDYTMELIGSQFKIVGNPRASSSCGCGTSFDVKV